MQKRNFYPEIYEDDGFLSLSCRAQQVAFFCMFGPAIRHLPIFKVSILSIQGKFHLQEESDWADVVAELEALGIGFVSGYCVIDGPALQYVSFAQSISGKNDAAVLAEVSRLPQPLKERLVTIPGINEALKRDLSTYVDGTIEPRRYTKEGITDVLTDPEIVDSAIPSTTSSSSDSSSDEKEASYGNAEINQLIEETKGKLGLVRLDGSEKKNRQMANILIRQHGSVEEVLELVAAAAADPFWKDHITSLQDIYYKQEKLRNLSRKSSIQVIDIGEPLAIEPAPKEWL